MGTRGLFGFFYKGKYYLVYNHLDSYPLGLGADLIGELRTADFEAWKAMLDKIIVVTEATIVTPEDIQRLSSYTDLTVSQQSTRDWYGLLRGCQGSYIKVLQSGYLLQAREDLTDIEKDLMIEYVYVANLDIMFFEIYAHGRCMAACSIPRGLPPNHKCIEDLQSLAEGQID